MSLIKQFTTSIYKFHNYSALMLCKNFHTVLYFIVFSVILSVISMSTVAKVYYYMGGVNGIFDKYVPEFAVSQGKLNCDIIDTEIGGIKIYVNTDGEYSCEDKSFDTVGYIIADNEGFVMYNGAIKTYQSFSDFGDITKSKLKEFFSQRIVKLTIALFIGFAILFDHILLGLLSVLIIALAGNLVNVLFNITKIKLSTLIKLAVYARTFPVLLSCVMAFFGLQLPTLVYYGLIITYMYLGLKNIRSGSGIIIAELEER